VTLLFILVIAFGLILGVFTKDQAFRKLGRLLIVAAFMPVIYNIAKNHFMALNWMHKALILLISVPIIIGVLLRILLGRDFYGRLAGSFVFGVFKSICALPFKIVSAIIRKYG
jgi:type III secretory pathway component EscT